MCIERFKGKVAPFFTSRITTLITFPKTAQASTTYLAECHEIGRTEQPEVGLHVFLSCEQPVLLPKNVPDVHAQRRSESEEHEGAVEFVVILVVSVEPGKINRHI